MLRSPCRQNLASLGLGIFPGSFSSTTSTGSSTTPCHAPCCFEDDEAAADEAATALEAAGSGDAGVETV